MNQSLTKEDLTSELEKVIIGGDLSKLSAGERLSFYKRTCDSLGLNPYTKPFEYITLNGKLTLYARKDATEQLRAIHGVSITKLEREISEGVYVVTAYLTNKDGRQDSSIGAVSIDGLKGEARANAMMKSETKAKRRGTLSICGLGMLDETEVETIPSAQPFVERTEPPAPPAPNGTLFDSTELDLAKKALRDLLANPRFTEAQRELSEQWLTKNPTAKQIQAKMRAQSVWLEDVQKPTPDADPPPQQEAS
jgi:hypothetical protein